MTDHIGEATQKVIDLDALEKRLRGAADDFSDHATPIEGDGQTATLLREAADVIAELTEARSTISDVDSAARQAASMNDAGYTVTVERTATHIYAMTSAFLARNGEGEG